MRRTIGEGHLLAPSNFVGRGHYHDKFRVADGVQPFVHCDSPTFWILYQIIVLIFSYISLLKDNRGQSYAKIGDKPLS